MVLTSQQKTNLSVNLSVVQSNFNDLAANNKRFMFVCFSDFNRLIMYSDDTNAFTSPIMVGKRTITLACTYDTTQDFTNQTNTFLA